MQERFTSENGKIDTPVQDDGIYLRVVINLEVIRALYNIDSSKSAQIKLKFSV